jgi:hypothetical protein
MKVLALLLLVLSPLLVSSTTHTFLSGRKYNANVLSREAARGIQSTVVQIRGGGLGGWMAKAPATKKTNKKAAPSASAAKKTNKKAAPSAPAAKITKRKSAPAAKKFSIALDFRERKKINKKAAPSAPAAPAATPAAKLVAKKKFSIDFRERKVQIGLLASLMFCYPIVTA